MASIAFPRIASSASILPPLPESRLSLKHGPVNIPTDRPFYRLTDLCDIDDVVPILHLLVTVLGVDVNALPPHYPGLDAVHHLVIK